MPIPNVAAPAAPTPAAPSQPEAQGGGGVLRSAKVAAQNFARMFGGVFKSAAPSGDLRGPAQ